MPPSIGNIHSSFPGLKNRIHTHPRQVGSPEPQHEMDVLNVFRLFPQKKHRERRIASMRFVYDKLRRFMLLLSSWVNFLDQSAMKN